MKVIPLKLTLLNPFFYYTQLSSKGTITGDFIGDLALTYALNSVLKQRNFRDRIFEQPNYSELRELPFTFTVGRPISAKLTRIYTRNTLFNTDGGAPLDILAGRHLFKNLWRVRGFQPGSLFSACLVCSEYFCQKLSLPIVLRIGTGRETLVFLEKDLEANEESEVWLNVFSLQNVYGNLDKLIQLLREGYHFEFKLKNYLIAKGAVVRYLYQIFRGVFEE